MQIFLIVFLFHKIITESPLPMSLLCMFSHFTHSHSFVMNTLHQFKHTNAVQDFIFCIIFRLNVLMGCCVMHFTNFRWLFRKQISNKLNVHNVQEKIDFLYVPSSLWVSDSSPLKQNCSVTHTVYLCCQWTKLLYIHLFWWIDFTQIGIVFVHNGLLGRIACLLSKWSDKKLLLMEIMDPSQTHLLAHGLKIREFKDLLL